MQATAAVLGPHWGVVPDEEQLVSATLVEQARRDPEAFAVLYRLYVDRIHGFCYRRTGSYEAAEEVTASVFERAWRGLPDFAWQGGGFEPWLFRIATNEIAGYFRQRYRTGTPRAQQVLGEMARELAAEDPDLVELLRADERDAEADALRRALAGLRPRYQAAISLRYLSGMSTQEAARALGCSKGTFAVTLHRALRAMRASLERDGTQ